MRFGKNVVVTKQAKNMVAVLAFSIGKKAQLPAIRITKHLTLRITKHLTLLTKSKINSSSYKFS